MTKQSEIDININGKESVTYEYTNCGISTVDFCNLDYDDFYEKYMLHNLPCIIKNVATDWVCSKHWIKDDIINYDHFLHQYGDLEAPVADCNQINFNSHRKIAMKVKDYISYLKETKKNKLLYLKDWHLKRLTKDEFYKVPKIFASDWLNEYAIDTNDDDFMFVYIGPKDTWTPFHSDVYLSYSWSVNIIGRKKWILLPPKEEIKLKDSLGNNPLLFDPNKHKNVKYFEIIQEKGDGIFVPSGWHHQVFNLLDTVSINHNFINACNLHFVWKALEENLTSVENEIKEFKDTPEYDSQCQLILKSIFGMDIESFIKFICHIANKRINYLNGKPFLLFNTYNLQKNDIIYDLNKIATIINDIEQNPIILKKSLPHDLESELLNVKYIINKLLK